MIISHHEIGIYTPINKISVGVTGWSPSDWVGLEPAPTGIYADLGRRGSLPLQEDLELGTALRAVHEPPLQNCRGLAGDEGAAKPKNWEGHSTLRLTVPLQMTHKIFMEVQ
jgi:hypothetical protein